jgi:hypothetical protein
MVTERDLVVAAIAGAIVYWWCRRSTGSYRSWRPPVTGMGVSAKTCGASAPVDPGPGNYSQL